MWIAVGVIVLALLGVLVFMGMRSRRPPTEEPPEPPAA
jgi:hypothetical protein